LSELDNIPVVSWLVLRGKCRTCGERISIRYPLVELATGGLFAAVAVRFGLDWPLAGFLLFTAALLALALIDLEHFLLPNRIIYPTLFASVPLLVGAAALGDYWRHFEERGSGLKGSIIGGLVAFGFFFLLNLIYPRGMAFGDVRLSGLIGVYLGWLGPATAFLGFFAAFLTGSIVGVGLILARRASRTTPIPFGVFLAIGAMLAIFFGRPFFDWYLG
jgi:leader peptidase (prepilin peptidase)/N-methyltransferase